VSIRTLSGSFPSPRTNLTSFFRPAILVAVAAGMSLTSAAHAQWTVTNLNPAGATTTSEAFATTGTQQAGIARILLGGARQAGIWSGAAASFVNLNPAGASSSEALATTGTQQAGIATIGGVIRAGIWSGTAGSWEALPMPPTGSWPISSANSIWSDATTLYVAGFGFNASINRGVALLWTRPIPTPSAAAVLAFGGVFGARRRRHSGK